MLHLPDCESIPLTNHAFRLWIYYAGKELQRLDQRSDDIQVEYYLSMNDDLRDQNLFNLKWDLIALKYAMAAVIHLWKQLRHEMD